MTKIDTNALKRDINLAEFISADLGISIKIEGKSYRLSNADHTLLVYKNTNDAWAYRAFRIHSKNTAGKQAYGNKNIFDYLDDIKNMDVKNNFLTSVDYIKQVDLTKAKYHNPVQTIAIKPISKKCYNEHNYKFVRSTLMNYGINKQKIYEFDTSLIQMHICNDSNKKYLAFPLFGYSENNKIIELGNALYDGIGKSAVSLDNTDSVWLSHINDKNFIKEITLFQSDVFLFQDALDALSYYQIYEKKGLYIALYNASSTNTLLTDVVSRSLQNGFKIYSYMQNNNFSSELLIALKNTYHDAVIMMASNEIIN